MPKRVQMSRQHPWRAENPDAVIVSRPSIYGNPFVVGRLYGPGGDVLGPDPYSIWYATAETVRDRTQAVALFREYVQHRRLFRYDPFGVTLVDRLRGHDLACWCPLDQPCHADVLLELANGERP